MVVKIRVVNKKGDICKEMPLRDAQQEITIGVKNGYIPVYDGKQVKAEEVQDGQEVTLFPSVAGG